MSPTQTILQLLADGHLLADQVASEPNVQKAESLIREANGYFQAANILLGAFGNLHNGLIDNPQFVAARRFCRRFPV